MISFFRRIFALIISRRVAELEHELADLRFAYHMAEHRIQDLDHALAEYRVGPNKVVRAQSNEDKWE